LGTVGSLGFGALLVCSGLFVCFVLVLRVGESAVAGRKLACRSEGSRRVLAWVVVVEKRGCSWLVMYLVRGSRSEAQTRALSNIRNTKQVLVSLAAW